jgi:selenocysteine lyase/cysteine desulfurase
MPNGNLDDTDWAMLRADFPTLEKFCYMNLANKAILPRSVEASMQSWLGDIYENAGAAAFSMDEIEKTRAQVADTFGAPKDCIALIKNTSEGVNIVAQGFPWTVGDNVVISEFEHENNTFPWRHLAKRGIEIRLAEPGPDGRIAVDQYRDIVDGRTRILAVGWVVYGNGYRADLRAISDFCHENDVKLLVDGIQAVGILSDRIDDLGADVLLAGGHKAQFSLAGAGFMYATPEMISSLTPPYAAKFSFDTLDRTVPDPGLATDAHRFEYGNPNFLGTWVQRRSAEYLKSVGLANIEARVRHLTTHLIETADQYQIRVRTPRPWEHRAGIVSLDLGRHAGDTVRKLGDQGIIVAEKDGHLRASLHFYNNEDDIERFFSALRSL